MYIKVVLRVVLHRYGLFRTSQSAISKCHLLAKPLENLKIQALPKSILTCIKADIPRPRPIKWFDGGINCQGLMWLCHRINALTLLQYTSKTA